MLYQASELSESLSITQMMVEYRIKRLLGSGMLLVRAIINNQKQRGLIFYELEISVDEAKQYEVIKQLREIYAEKLWSVRTLTAEILLANFCVYSCRARRSICKHTSNWGCKIMFFFHIQGNRWTKKPNWIDGLIEQKIAESSKPRGDANYSIDAIRNHDGKNSSVTDRH